MTLLSVVLGLLAAVIFYVVATALIVFAHSVLIFGLIAVVVFFLVASGGAGVRLP